MTHPFSSNQIWNQLQNTSSTLGPLCDKRGQDLFFSSSTLWLVCLFSSDEIQIPSSVICLIPQMMSSSFSINCQGSLFVKWIVSSTFNPQIIHCVIILLLTQAECLQIIVVVGAPTFPILAVILVRTHTTTISSLV